MSEEMIIPSYTDLQVAWQRLGGKLIEKDAEIERLRDAYESSQATVLKYWEQRTSDHKLITELADALDITTQLLLISDLSEQLVKNKTSENKLLQKRAKDAMTVSRNTLK